MKKSIKTIIVLVPIVTSIITVVVLYKQINFLACLSAAPFREIEVANRVRCFDEICSVISLIIYPDEKNQVSNIKLGRIALKNHHFIPRKALEEVLSIIKISRNKSKLNEKDQAEIKEHFIRFQEIFLKVIDKDLATSS